MRLMVSRVKHKGRRTSGGFISLPHAVVDSDAFKQLTPQGVKLMIDIARQFNGSNNGDFSATISMMKERGWNSASTLAERLDELMHYGLIEKTRQGGKHKCSLYAVAWKSIDECERKLDVKETRVASGSWKGTKERWVPKRRRKLRSVHRRSNQLTSNYTADRTNYEVSEAELHRRSNQSGGIGRNNCTADRTPFYIYTKGTVFMNAQQGIIPKNFTALHGKWLRYLDVSTGEWVEDKPEELVASCGNTETGRVFFSVTKSPLSEAICAA
ncbi:MAG: hypothetical protein HOB39_09170 [Gammaproteobacteria bacterium]|nr:hypothetical protein [Gammaproteobacteria bacterium]